MPFNSALQPSQYTALRGSGSAPRHAADQLLCVGSNTVVLSARVNQAAFTASFAQITYDGASGSYTDVQPGMTVLISRTNDQRAAFFVGRVRLAPSSTVLYVNETSATISDDDYIWVLRDFRLFYELGRESGGVYYKDYDLTFTALRPIIYGLQAAYAGIVSGSPAGYTVSFAAQALAATAGATISSYAWTIPSGGTVTAGATNTANVTVRFDAAAAEYWVRLVVTDSGGRTQTRWIPVWAIPADLSTTVARGFGGASLDNTLDGGWTATVEAFEGVEALLDNTLVCVVDVEYYNGAAQSINSAVKFVGRFRSEAIEAQPDGTYSTLRRTRYEVEGPAAQMARLTTPLITMRDDASPNAWDEIDDLTIWRALTYLLEHSTFHQLYSLSFDSTANTYRAYQLNAPQGNLLDSANDLLKSINALLEFAPTGEARAVRDLRYVGSAARDAAVVVADFTSEDWIGFTLNRKHIETVGLVEASGGTYAPSGGILPQMVTPLLSVAPGVAQGNAEGVTQLTRQILTGDVDSITAQDELNERAGNHYAKENSSDELDVEHRGAYNFLIASVGQWYTFTIAADDSTGGRAYTTADRWLCTSVTINHDNESGRKDVRATYARETSGADAGATGQTVQVPAPTEITINLPSIPPFDAYFNFPALPSIYLPANPTIGQVPPALGVNPTPVIQVPSNGNSVMYWSALRVWVSTTFLTLAIPKDVTPPDLLGTVRDAILVGKSAYVLSSDGFSSQVYYKADVFANPVEWESGAAIDGVYTQIEAGDGAGEVYIKGQVSSGEAEEGDWDITLDFTQSSYGFTVGTHPQIAGATNAGRWVAGQGWQLRASNYYAFLFVTSPAFDATDLYRLQTEIYYNNSDAITLGGPNLSDAKIQVTRSNSSTDLSGAYAPTPLDTGTGLQAVGQLGVTNATDVVDFSIAVRQYPGSVQNGWAPTYITGIRILGNGPVPVFVTDAYGTRYSDDYGQTFAALVSAGTAPAGEGGLGTQKLGDAVLVGSDGQVQIATTDGGAYSAYGSAMPTDAQPAAIVQPRYQFSSTTVGNINTGTPQYLVGSNVLSSGGASLWRVTASGATFTDITPIVSSDEGLVIAPKSLAMPWWSGSRIAAILDFGGSPRLVVSTNAGTAWTDRGILDDDARMVTYRKGDKTMQQLFFANGGPAYSPNHGQSIIVKPYPGDSATEPVIGIAVYG